MRSIRQFAACAFGAWAALGGVVVAQNEIGAQGAGANDAATHDAAVAAAVEEVKAEAPKGFWEQDYLTGEWGGLRKQWRDAGVDLQFLLTVDFGKNVTGGVESGGSEVLSVFDAIAALDLDTLFGWSGAKLVADFQLIRGDGLNTMVGAIGGADALDSGPRTQLAQLYLDQSFADGLFKVRLGKFDANYDFAFPATTAPFFNSGVVASPTLLNMPTYPNPAFGAAVYFEPESFYVRAAVMDGASLEGVNTGHHGPGTLFGKPADLYFIVEGGPKWTLGDGLEGKLGVGAWGHNGTFTNFDGSPNEDAWGPYAMLEQRLSRENPSDKDDAQGIAAFLRYGGGSDRIGAVGTHLAGGVTWTGAIDGRDADVAGFSISWSDASSDPSSGFDRSSETAFELFYKLQLAPWLSVQPDVQYFVNPGATSGADDAWLVSLRVFVSF